MIKGKAWVFGDDVDTDVIIPGKYLRTKDCPGLGRSMPWRAWTRSLQQSVQKGDIIVAGSNFGSGSSREQAPRALKGAGVSVVVARSFARIFYRNAINVGLPLVEADVVCRAGDLVEVDLAAGTCGWARVSIRERRLPDFLMEILEDGGLVAHRRRQKGLA